MGEEIKVTRSSLPAFDEYIQEIKSLWDSRWLTNSGEKHKALEVGLSDFLEVPYLALLTNGHLALEYAIEALSLKGEVITTPFTFVSTTNAIIRKGLTPVFGDINEHDYTLDADKIESLITEKTCAIIPVHVYGNPCDIEQIDQLAKRYGLHVIYDAAHAFGVTINDRSIAGYGDASMFSFHATKVFNTIEGGAVISNNEELIKKIDILKNFGMTGKESTEYAGGNAKMNEFQAAMGICNLRHINEHIEKRKAIVERYYEHLDNVSGIQLVAPKGHVKSNYAYFPVLFDGFRHNRDEIYEALEKEKIFSRKYFYPLTSRFTHVSDIRDINDTPVAAHVADCVLTLPLYHELSLDSVDRICRIIKGV